MDFTPTERKILLFLGDGMRHPTAQVLAHLDPFMSIKALSYHICNLRTKLQKVGQDIVCEVDGRKTFHYRRVILLGSVDE